MSRGCRVAPISQCQRGRPGAGIPEGGSQIDATAILLANLAEIYDQLRKLRDTAGLTEDEIRAVDELLAEIDELPSDQLVNIDDIDYLASAASRLKLTLEARVAGKPTDGPS